MRPETRAGMAKLLTGINFDNVLPKIQAPTLVITTDHSAFDYRLVLEHSRSVVDTRNALGRAAGVRDPGRAAEMADVVRLGAYRPPQRASVAA